MDDVEWGKLPKEKTLRLLVRIEELSKRCIDCFEQLTLAERLQGRGYCTNCFPKEMEGEPDDASA